jgi:hypothetical protein
VLSVAKGLEEIAPLLETEGEGLPSEAVWAPLSDGRCEVVSDCVEVLEVQGEVETVRAGLSVAKALEEIAPLLETEGEGLPSEAVPVPLSDGRWEAVGECSEVLDIEGEGDTVLLKVPAEGLFPGVHDTLYDRREDPVWENETVPEFEKRLVDERETKGLFERVLLLEAVFEFETEAV